MSVSEKKWKRNARIFLERNGKFNTGKSSKFQATMHEYSSSKRRWIFATEYLYLPLNAQGLTMKYTCLTDFLSEHNPDIVTIAETWLTKGIKSDKFYPPSYMGYKRDFVSNDYSGRNYVNSAQGDIAVLVKASLDSVLQQD